MSPSERKARSLGVLPGREDFSVSASGKRERFMTFTLISRAGRRNELKVSWKTKRGSWQAAWRWAKKLIEGEL